MLELDVMLTRFLENRYEGISSAQQADFVNLLGCEDDQLWDWLSGRTTPEEPRRKWLIEQIRLPAAS